MSTHFHLFFHSFFFFRIYSNSPYLVDKMVSNATGGSYMTLPFSNSEAVKWALTSSPPLPIRCNQNIYSYIKPPFATIPNETRRQKSIGKTQIDLSSHLKTSFVSLSKVFTFNINFIKVGWLVGFFVLRCINPFRVI